MTSDALLSTPHTLAQFARRVGMHEGSLRKLRSGAGRLPEPDLTDADGKPLWYGSTIDAWCAATGRPVPGGALWIYRVPAATAPAPISFAGVVDYPRYGGEPSAGVHVVVYDTPYGPIAWARGLTEGTGAWLDRTDTARAALQVLPPDTHRQAVIAVTTLAMWPSYDTGTLGLDMNNVDLYTVRTAEEPDAPGLAARLLGRQRSAPTADRATVQRAELTTLPALARVLGRRLPLWLEGTATRQVAQVLGAAETTLTVPDATTDWPEAHALVLAALDGGFEQRYPAAAAALATDAAGVLQAVREQHTKLPDRGERWFLAVRPAAPQVPIALETALTRPRPAAAPEQVLAELDQLIEARDTAVAGAPRTRALARAVELLLGRLPAGAIERATWRPYTWMATSGPVDDVWRTGLTEHPQLELARRSERLARLIGAEADPGEVQSLFVDTAGRWTAERFGPGTAGNRLLIAEWPTERSPLPQLTDDTVIAADPGESAVPVFALIPDADGELHAEPIPSPGGLSFAYGYGGGSPRHLYRALARLVPGLDGRHLPGHDAPSELLAELTTPRQGLRLGWPQVQDWARADAAR